ncbi:hypothetical protein BDF22DRAFT_673770 [Syncephalis plumigaleata]|nr:hypothetical protein BDF22DRAFT_673770 [Syncephalis plumigaleata]
MLSILRSSTALSVRRSTACTYQFQLHRHYSSLSTRWTAEKDKLLYSQRATTTATTQTITLPDGQTYEYQPGITTPNTLLENWNPELLPRTVGALFRGQLWELYQPLNTSGLPLLNRATTSTTQSNDTLTFLSANDTLVTPFYASSAAMVLGKALSLEYPNDIIAGSIDVSSDGRAPNFAYDSMLLSSSTTSSDNVKSQLREILASAKEMNDCYERVAQLLNDTSVRHISEHDLKTLTKRVNSIINAALPIERLDVPLATAIDLLSYDPLKVYRIRHNYTAQKTVIPLYRIGDYIDVASGPLLPRTDLLQHTTLTAVSARHWWAERDKARAKQQITRVAGVTFPTALKYQQWRQSQEQAHQRDHRVIGTNQQLFHFDVNSPGGPFFLPHGTRIVERLFSFLRSEYRRFGYDEVMTPMIYKKALWEQSGHWQNYAEDMFAVRGGLPDTTTEVMAIADGNKTSSVDWYGLKPMNCPAHCLIYASQPRTAHELPLRFADFGSLHRWEAAGALSGLTRVRNFHQDDAHIFCRHDQIGQEIRSTLDMVERIYSTLKFDQYELYLSTRPEQHYIGSIEDWQEAERALSDALNATGRVWQVNPGDGAFYGPKIDIYISDALGRRHQTATIQLDFQLPQRFDLKYTDTKSNQQQHVRPVIIHRAIMGSLERMMAILTEHYAGDWPLWQSPRQVMICPVASTFVDYAHKVRHQLTTLHDQYGLPLYVDVNTTGHSLGKMIRQAEKLRYNYLLVLGEQEATKQLVTIRKRGERASTSMPISEFGASLLKSIQARD